MIRRALPLSLALLACASAPAFAQSVNTGPGCAAGITCSTGTVTGSAANSFELNNVTATATVPTLIPDKADPTTGIGSAGTGNIDVVSGGNRITQWTTSGPLEFQDVVGNSASGFRLIGGNASATAPTVVPNRSDTKAGIGADAAGDVSVIVDKSTVATEALRVTPTGVFNFSTIPVVTGTGTPTIATGSSDTAGEVTSGTSATSVIITFSAAKTNAPFCVVSPQTQLAAFVYTISTTAITITQTATTGEKIDYHCFQH